MLSEELETKARQQAARTLKATNQKKRDESSDMPSSIESAEKVEADQEALAKLTRRHVDDRIRDLRERRGVEKEHRHWLKSFGITASWFGVVKLGVEVWQWFRSLAG